MFTRWVETVRSLIKRRLAISRLAKPWTTYATISRSRSHSFSSHSFELPLRNQVGDPRPVRLVLALHQLPKLISRVLLEQVNVVELTRVLHRGVDELVFVLSGKDLAARRAGESQRRAAVLVWHTAGPSLQRARQTTAPI